MSPAITIRDDDEVTLTIEVDGDAFELVTVEVNRSLPGLTKVRLTKKQIDRMAGFAANTQAKREVAKV